MNTVRKDNFVFSIDSEKTRQYYLKNSLCECCACRNLYAQINNISPELSQFFSEFDIDICRPDECADIDMGEYVDYLFVGYTVVGNIETDGKYEKDIGDFHITISKGDTPYDWFPNEQKEPCFFVSVTGISLPWIVDKPDSDSVKLIDKIKQLFIT